MKSELLLSYKLFLRDVKETDDSPSVNALNYIWNKMSKLEQEEARRIAIYFDFVEEFKNALRTGKSFEYPVDADMRTFLYTLRAHLRRKIHMRWYKKYHGGQAFLPGWKYRRTSTGEIDNEITGLEINDLETQAKWIKEYVGIKKAWNSWSGTKQKFPEFWIKVVEELVQ